MKTKLRLTPLFTVSLLCTLSAAAFAQLSAPAWGTTSLSSEVIGSSDLQPDSSLTQFATDPVNGNRFLTGTGVLYAAVHLPQGALITGIELDACDPLDNGFVQTTLYRATAVSKQNLVFATTGLTEADGCSRWLNELAVPEVVDNQTNRYFVEAGTVPSAETETIGAVRVYYQLQVSPPPATASFGDVPTGHPFFQFVEALASSGITAGCGGVNYCPDSPLTRGQMAVFLAKALGLHWPVAPTMN